MAWILGQLYSIEAMVEVGDHLHIDKIGDAPELLVTVQKTMVHSFVNQICGYWLCPREAIVL